MMTIAPISSIYTQSFGAKSPEARTADDIQRKTRTAFPFFSPSYADVYYSSCSSAYHSDCPSEAVQHWDNMYTLDRMAAKMGIIREARSENLCGRHNFTNKVQETVNDIKKYHLANCEESATLILGNLLANGYQNSMKCSLKFETKVYEKGKKDCIYVERDNLDHACVLSTMDKNPNNKAKYYVLDGWFGFADSMQGAIGRYNQLIDKKKIEKAKQKAIVQFTKANQGKYKDFDLNNFEIRQHIVCDLKEIAAEEDKAKLKKLFTAKYPELIEQ